MDGGRGSQAQEEEYNHQNGKLIMSKKPLQTQIDSTKQIISQQMSQQKTTLKEFVSFYKDMQAILKSTVEQLIKLSRKPFTCREFENDLLKQVLDNGVIALLKISDLLGRSVDQLRQIEEAVNQTYLDIRKRKEEILLQLNDGIKKERDNLYERNLKQNDQQSKQQLDAFTQTALTQMQDMLAQAQKTMKAKDKAIIDSMKMNLEEQLKCLDLLKTVTKGQFDYFSNLPSFEENNVLIQQKIQLQRSSSQSSRQMSANSAKNIKSPSPQKTTDITTDHKERILEIKKKYNSSMIVAQMPPQIKDQIGIFTSEMPYHLDIAKEFSQSDFHSLILLLMMEYKSQHQEWQTLVTHTKNKFKITMAQFKSLEAAHKAIISKAEDDPMLVSTFQRISKGVLKWQSDEQTKRFSRSLVLFSQINEFWAQYYISVIFQASTIVKKDSFVGQFKTIIDQLIFQELDYNAITFLKGSEITYPLNQCLLEILLQVLITQSELELDYLSLIQKFSFEVLQLSPGHTSITLLQLAFAKIIQPALSQKDLQIADALAAMDSAIEILMLSISQENSINQTQIQRVLKLKNSEKLFAEVQNLVRHFWQQLPSDRSFLKKYSKLFYATCLIQQEFTQYKSIQQLIGHIFQQTGHNFYNMILKRDQLNFNQISQTTLAHVAALIPIICKEAAELNVGYIKPLSETIEQTLKDEGFAKFAFMNFLTGMLEELIAIISQIEVCQKNKAIPEDNHGNVFVICFQLAILDDSIYPYSIMAPVLQQLGPSLELWAQNTQMKTQEILAKTIQQEKFLDPNQTFKQLLDQKHTHYAQDFCSLLFKSVEALEQVFKLSDTSEFKKLISSRIQAIIYQAIMMYLEALELNVADWAKKYYNWFPPVQKLSAKYQIDEKAQAQQQLHLAIQLMMRICNMNFIQQQLEYLKQRPNFKLVQNLDNDFSTKGKSICKNISNILCNEVYQVNMFTPIYSDLQKLVSVAEYAKCESSITSRLQDVEDFFMVFNSKLPTPYYSIFYEQLIPTFFEKLYYSLIDLNKLQNVNQKVYAQLICFEMNELQRFWMKNITNNVLQLRIQQAISEIKDVGLWFDLSNQDLIKTFEEQNIKNNKSKAAGLYRLMMLRKSDSKVKEVLKKYQKIYE